MAKYKSDAASIPHDITTVYSKLSDSEALGRMVALLPDEARERMKDVEFSADGISFKYNGMGPIVIGVVESNEPERVVYGAKSSPVPFNIAVDLKPIDAATTQGIVTTELDIPIFLKPMVQGPLTKGMEKVATLLAMIPYDKI